MFHIQVNGCSYVVEQDKRLLDYLRDDLGLTGTKDGCSAGACGACTILVEGKKAKACVYRLSQVEDKPIITIEGLTERERDVYAYAFGKVGAVQCGFCIPGMVMSSKALLMETVNPTEEEIRRAIAGNICRCTGYVKIIEAIQLAARLFRTGETVPQPLETGRIGTALPRLDAKEKVLGTGLYGDDFHVEGMLYGKAVRSAYPRAKVLRIDPTRALAHTKCVTVLTAKDVPFNKVGHLVVDWDVMIPEGGITRYEGDAIALVAVTDKAYLEEVASLVQVDYEELTPLLSPWEALAEGAPAIHEGGNVLSRQALHRGNAKEAIQQAAYVVRRHYSTPQTEHAFMEPECAVAIPEGAERLTVYTASQSIYDEQREIARMLQWPLENVRVRSLLVGGGFGGKEDMSVQHHAALLAWKTGCPVKVKFTRQESIQVHVKRHAMEIDVTTACDETGRLVASEVSIVSDCGAYASLGGPVLQRACTHAGGPYHFEHFSAEGTCVYTNHVPGGAFRGFGVTQSAYAQECNIDALAHMVGMDPWEFRHKNVIRPGQVLPNGQLAGPDTGALACLEAVKAAYDKGAHTGIALAMKNSGLGVGVPDVGRVILEVRGGKVHIRTSAACMGQGIGTVAFQMVCESTGLPPECVVLEAPDTERTPNAGTTTASRQTLFTGEACRRAGLALKEKLRDATLESLEGLEVYGEFEGVTDPMGSDKENPVSHVAYSYGACVADLDEQGKVTDLHVAYDVGRVVNPQSCESQAEGGAIMGMGYALTENVLYDGGTVKSTYGTLGLLRSLQCPTIHVTLVEPGDAEGLAYGAKGIGEISCIPIAPAIANAYARLDGIERRSLPLEQTPYRPKR